MTTDLFYHPADLKNLPRETKTKPTQPGDWRISKNRQVLFEMRVVRHDHDQFLCQG